MGGKTVFGDAALEKARAGEAFILKMHYREEGIDYEESCLFMSDLDNYARISCYLYEPGKRTKSPGLESFFHDHANR